MTDKKQPSQQPKPAPPEQKELPDRRGYNLPPTSADPPMPPVKPPAKPKE